MKEDIIEGNKLIAKFDGFIYYDEVIGYDDWGSYPSLSEELTAAWVRLHPEESEFNKLFIEHKRIYSHFYEQFDIEIPFIDYHYNLRYHSSWDWLMPVVEKIEAMGYKTVLATSEWGNKYYQNIITGVGIIKETIENPSKFMGQSDTKIEAVYKATIEFIKWYNQTKK